MHFKSTENSRQEISFIKHTYEFYNLSSAEIKHIEKSDFILSGHKAQLLQLTTGTRMTMELWPKQYELDSKRGIYVANKEEVAMLEVFLKALPFPYRKLTYYRESDQEDFLKESLMFQISANVFVDEYISNYWQTFSAYEQGVLYGYPTTSILAFLSILERFPISNRLAYTPAMTFIGPGIYSKSFVEEEKSYYEKIWKTLEEMSPNIIDECKNSITSLA